MYHIDGDGVQDTYRCSAYLPTLKDGGKCMPSFADAQHAAIITGDCGVTVQSLSLLGRDTGIRRGGINL